jgi:hypothetical protein
VDLRSGEARRDIAVTLGGRAAIHGVVLGADTGLPVAGARVVAGPSSGGVLVREAGGYRNVTDAQGRFDLDGVPAGQIRVLVVPPSSRYRTSETSARIDAGATTELAPVRLALAPSQL